MLGCSERDVGEFFFRSLNFESKLNSLNHESVPVLCSSVQVVDSARHLDVVIDSHLTMVDHVTAVCRAAYFHLRQLRVITRCSQ